MSQPIRYAGETDSGRGPSAALWNEAEGSIFRYMHGDFGAGILFQDDFLSLVTGKHTATQATAGTFALDDAEGGVALADCNSTTATQGINVQLNSTVGELFKAEAGKDLFFEARIKAADIATGPEFFLGLHNIDTTIIASSAMDAAAGDWIGFKSLTDDGVLLGTAADNSSETTASSIHTLVDDTWVKLGFKVSGTSKVELYVDGVLKGNTVAANIPTALMVPSLVCQSGGTTDPIVHIDWWRVYKQLSA